MNKQELKSKIEKLEKGIASKVTPENLKASLKSQKAKFEKELADLEKKEKKDKAAVSDKIKSLRDKVKSKVSSITRDGARKAKKAGKRIAEDGSVYYEKRANRTDSQTKKKPYLEKGGELEGMIAEIYRSDYDSPTNKMYGKKGVTIIDKDVPKIFEPSERNPAVRLVRRKLNFDNKEYEYIHAIPYDQPEHRGMFGGTFIYSSDSRFPAKYPIPLHDRVESHEEGGELDTDSKEWKEKMIKNHKETVKGYEQMLEKAKKIGQSDWDIHQIKKNIEFHNNMIKDYQKEVESMAAGGELNLGIRKMAQEEGFTPKELGKEYQLVMGQAVVEALTDANYHSEARKLVSILEKNPKIAEKPNYPNPSDPEFKQKMAQIEKEYASEYWDADDKTRNFAIKVSQKSGWDGYAIASAFEYLVRIDGGYHKLADAIEKAMESSDEMAKGGYVIFEGVDYENEKPLYQVISKDEDNDYVGEWHDNKEDAENELKSLSKKSMADGGETSKNINVFGYDTLNFDICPLAIEEFEKAVVALEGSSDSTKLALSRAAMYLDDVFGVEKQSKADKSVSKNEFEYAVNQALVATSYNYAAGLEVNLFKIVPMHISKIANLLVDENKDEEVTAFDLLNARDKAGEAAFKAMTPEERVIYARELKSGNLPFEEGGYMAKGGSIKGFSVGDNVKYKGKDAVYTAKVLEVIHHKELPYAKIKWDDNGKIEEAYLDDLVKFEEGGYMAKGGELTNEQKIEKLLVKKSDLETKLLDARIKENELISNRGFGYGMRHSKIGFSTKRTDSLKERIKKVGDELKNLGYNKMYSKGGELANGAYYLGKPKKQGIIWSQTVVDISDNSIDFAKDYARKIKDFNATGKKKLSNEEFAKFLKEDKRGENLSSESEKWESYAAGGMIVGRWYKDNQGVEHRYIGEDATGQPLFSNGEKVSTKSLDDFEPSTKESKMFKWFNEGGEIKDEFLEDMAELHKEIAEITLVDGSKISGEELRAEHHKYAKGGEAKFSDKVKAIKASLLKKKKVSPKVQKDYGKTYNSKEAEQAAKRIAGAMRKKGMK